ncbi:MAG: beta-galactosidase, partial [Tannerella sp.]|nr:beta-galactosidase [Tannerella sp.]
PAINVYHSVQDGQDGQQIAYSGDFMRTVAKDNYIIAETNAQATGWDSRGQYPPYDGQLRQNVYSHIASGSNMVEYWHWHTLHYGQETYWRGVIGQDLQPNRIYREFASTAKELNVIGKNLVNLKKDNKVAILYSHDSYHALSFMPYTQKAQYPAQMVHQALYFQNIETDIIPCDKWMDFSQYKMLVIPPLYVATNELLEKIDQFVKDGGQVVMLYKSGYCNEHSAVRATLAPGPLRKACGFYYQEYSTIQPLRLKDNVFDLKGNNPISDWYEFLILETAKPLAYADHPFFGQWPVVTENAYGKGNLFYIGAYPSVELLEKVIRLAAEKSGIITSKNNERFPVIFRSGKNSAGKQIHYVFNYSGQDKEIRYPFASGKELLSGKNIGNGQTLTLKPWDVVIVEE